MPPSKQLHSLEQFLAQAQGPSVPWADVDDDPELYAPLEEPPEEVIDDLASSSRSQHIPNLPTSPPFVIFCGNLSHDCTVQDLREFFSPIVPTDVRVVLDTITKRVKGFGYVEFGTRDDMERAFDLNAHTLLNRPIRIDLQINRENVPRPARRHVQAPAAVPAERPKLVLKPRTLDKQSEPIVTQKLNPFGAARPREEVLKEKAAAATPAAAPVVEEHKFVNANRSRSPAVRTREAPVVANVRPKKSAWGPPQSVLAVPSNDEAPTPAMQDSYQPRGSWTSRGPMPRADSEVNRDSRPFRSTSYRGGGHLHLESHQQGSRPLGTDKGPERLPHDYADKVRPPHDHDGKGRERPPHDYAGKVRLPNGHDGKGPVRPPHDYDGKGRERPPHDYAGKGPVRPPHDYAGKGRERPPHDYAGKGPVRPHHDYDGKNSVRPHLGHAETGSVRPARRDQLDKGPAPDNRPASHRQYSGDRRTGPRFNGDEYRSRRQHDEHTAGGRENPSASEMVSPSDSAVNAADIEAKSPIDRVQSHSPLKTDADDNSGFEMQRKGRRNGGGRVMAPMSNLQINASRKEKATDKAAGRKQHTSPKELPSFLTFTSNIFSGLAEVNDD